MAPVGHATPIERETMRSIPASIIASTRSLRRVPSSVPKYIVIDKQAAKLAMSWHEAREVHFRVPIKPLSDDD